MNRFLGTGENMQTTGIMIEDMKALLTTTGQRVRVLREHEGYDQSELAAIVQRHGVKCTNSHISKIELGDSAPSWEVAIVLADALKTSLDYLAVRTDNADALTDRGEPEPVYVSPEADEVARLMDYELSEFRRRDVLLFARALAEAGAETEQAIMAAADLVANELRGAQLVVGDKSIDIIATALRQGLAFLATAQPPVKRR